jgi:hypothetical protein
MTDLASASMPEPEPQSPDGGRAKQVLIAIVIAVLVVIGLKIVIGRWVRGGGPRRSITGIAEDGAVKLADALLDEVLGPV